MQIKLAGVHAVFHHVYPAFLPEFLQGLNEVILDRNLEAGPISINLAGKAHLGPLFQFYLMHIYQILHLIFRVIPQKLITEENMQQLECIPTSESRDPCCSQEPVRLYRSVVVHDDKELYLQFILVHGLQDIQHTVPRLRVVIQIWLIGLQEHAETDDDLLEFRRVQISIPGIDHVDVVSEEVEEVQAEFWPIVENAIRHLL